MMKVRLKRKHAAGYVKIHDRKLVEKDGKKQEVKIFHRIGPNGFDKEIYEEDYKDLKDGQMKTRKKTRYIGKPFEVNDGEYVLNRHGAILEKA